MRGLGLDAQKPILVHSSLKAFGNVQGGADTAAAALLDVFDKVMVPTFTYKTMVVPEAGPPDNAIRYGAHTDQNKMAEFFHPEMPADKMMGKIAEVIRTHPDAVRSGHPVLSFAGINVEKYLETQLLSEPYAPIAAMYDDGGWVVLLGVDHTSNTTIHLGERLAGRQRYLRWALMSDMIVACPNFPYCSDGFNAIQPLMAPFLKSTLVGSALIQAMPIPELVDTVRQLLEADPTALLCNRTDCLACNTIRRNIQQAKGR